jgi:multiple sugar transport system permease protein
MTAEMATADPALAASRPPEPAPAAPRRMGRQRAAGRAITYVVAAVMALFILIPIYLITVSAVTPRESAFDYPRELIPSVISFDTIFFFINASGVQDAFWRSVIVALITLVLALAIGAPAGYALARYAFRGRETYRLTVLSTRAFPIVILAIPLAVTYLRLGINDSVLGVALMHTALALPFTVLITSSVFASVPRELEEAAQTLGCTPLSAFLRVSLPLALPGLAAAAIFTWVISWNDVFAAVILTLRNPTLPAKILTALTQSPIYYQFAAGFVMLLPSIIVIFFIRRYLLGLWGRVVK